jgi:hypothetical protein
MWEILEVLRRAGRGESITKIKQATGRSRKTIRRYVRVAHGLGWTQGKQEPSEELAGAVQQHLRPVPEDVGLGAAEKQLLPHQKRIRTWLDGSDGERGLRLTKVHQLLTRKGVKIPYSSLHRFAVKHCGFADRRRLTVRRAPCEPGELAEVDFGRLGLVWDPDTGRQRVLHALIVTLVHSRHKAAVTKADRYDPVFHRTFEEYAHYRGFVIDPAVPRHAKGKPVVERAVSYVRDSFFRGEEWSDRWQVQGRAVLWCLETAGTRIHGTTRKRPLAVFENVEKPALRPLERERFDPPLWGQCTVHGDHHVSFQKAIYSVPTQWVGRRVWVRADTKLVRVYADGRLVKTHPLQEPGGRSTDYDDYPKELTPYALRDPDRLVQAARQRGQHLGSFMTELLRGDFPWAKLRQGMKLLRLCDKYGDKRVDGACQRALRFGLVNVRRVESIIQQNLEPTPAPQSCSTPASVLPLRFARDPQSFIHPKPEGGDHD